MAAGKKKKTMSSCILHTCDSMGWACSAYNLYGRDKVQFYRFPARVGVICNCNIKINSNLPFFNVIASNQLLCCLTITVIGNINRLVLKVIVISYFFLLHLSSYHRVCICYRMLRGKQELAMHM